MKRGRLSTSVSLNRSRTTQLCAWSTRTIRIPACVWLEIVRFAPNKIGPISPLLSKSRQTSWIYRHLSTLPSLPRLSMSLFLMKSKPLQNHLRSDSLNPTLRIPLQHFMVLLPPLPNPKILLRVCWSLPILPACWMARPIPKRVNHKKARNLWSILQVQSPPTIANFQIDNDGDYSVDHVTINLRVQSCASLSDHLSLIWKFSIILSLSKPNTIKTSRLWENL